MSGGHVQRIEVGREDCSAGPRTPTSWAPTYWAIPHSSWAAPTKTARALA